MFVQPSQSLSLPGTGRLGTASNAGVFSRGTVWLSALLVTICFEGWVRKVFPQLPSAIIYFAKDAVLLAALPLFGIRREVLNLGKAMYGRWSIFLFLTMIWTVLEVANPYQGSLTLALIGLRSYWVWWLAPFLVATAVPLKADRNKVAMVLAVLAIFISFYSAAQFAAPPDSEINAYARYDGEVIMQTAYFFNSGRARVSGTFAYLSGFADFAVAAPVILLGIGLDAGMRVRLLAIAGSVFITANCAMAGSRNAIILAAVGLSVVLFRSGFVRTRAGLWAIIGIAAAATASVYYTNEAMKNVMFRFEGGDTMDRIERELRILPPVALLRTPYELFGVGTGMAQNARFQFDVVTNDFLEEEPPRLLLELGPVGFLLFWFARLGLLLTLVKSSKILKRAGMMGASGAAAALAVLTMFNRIVFDHVWQSLYFIALGLLLSATREALQRLGPTRAPAAPDRGQRALLQPRAPATEPG
jgi:hypothetical protein